MPNSTNKVNMSDHAAAAKQVRAFMKAQGIKGTVKAARAAGTSSLTIRLDNGSPEQVATVTAFSDKFQYGHFDPMTDSYEYSNSRDDVPQVRYIFVDAVFDTETKQRALDALSKQFDLPAMTYDNAPYDLTICGEKQNTYSAMRGVLLGTHYPPVPLWEKAA